MTTTRIRGPRLPRRPNARSAQGEELAGFEQEKDLIADAFATICTAGGLRLKAPVSLFAERSLSPVLDRKIRRYYPDYQKALFMTTYAAATVNYVPGNMPTEAVAWAFNTSVHKMGHWDIVGPERDLDFFICKISYVHPHIQKPDMAYLQLRYQTLEEPFVPQKLLSNARAFASSGEYDKILTSTLPWVARRAEADVYRALAGGEELTPYLRARLAAGGGDMDNVVAQLRADAVRLQRIANKLKPR